MKKKIVSIVLASAMVVSLAACGNSQAPETTAEAAPEATTEAPAAETTAATAETTTA